MDEGHLAWPSRLQWPPHAVGLGSLDPSLPQPILPPLSRRELREAGPLQASPPASGSVPGLAQPLPWDYLKCWSSTGPVSGGQAAGHPSFGRTSFVHKTIVRVPFDVAELLKGPEENG